MLDDVHTYSKNIFQAKFNSKKLKKEQISDKLIELLGRILSINKKSRPNHEEILTHECIVKKDKYNKISRKATKSILKKMTKRARITSIQKKIRE